MATAAASFQKGDRLDTSKLKRHKFPLPEIGEGKYLTLRALSAPEVETHVANGPDGQEKGITGYKLISVAAVLDDNTPIFEDEEDARKNLDVSAESLQAMVKKILELSGLQADKDRSKN